MSTQSAKAFIEKMKTDEEFCKKVAELKNPKERMTFVRQAGFDFTEEEIRQEKSQLTDEEIMKAAGGDIFEDIMRSQPNFDNLADKIRSGANQCTK